MEALKHGSKYKEPVPPKIYDIVCNRCGCEYRVEDPEEGKIWNPDLEEVKKKLKYGGYCIVTAGFID